VEDQAVDFADLVDRFTGRAGVTLPQEPDRHAFGAGALKVDGSIFAMEVRERIVLKLPAVRVSQLIAAGTGEPFRNGKGSPMREWVAITTDQASTVTRLAEEALAFVGRRGYPER
jgi:hypothetical protein